MAELTVKQTRVFGIKPAEGNPCPVIKEEKPLTNAQRQSLAAQFGEETAFILPAETADTLARLRFFVPGGEMEMCVHGTIGAITTLAGGEWPARGEGFVQTNGGNTKVRWEPAGAECAVNVGQFPPLFGSAGKRPERTEIAAALGIESAEIEQADLPLEVVSVGRAKVLIPVRDYHVLAKMRPDFPQLWRLCAKYEATGFYPFTRAGRTEARGTPGGSVYLEARQFPRQSGYNEDAATGVAAGALGAYLARYAAPDQREQRHIYIIEQGHDMGRPCRMEVTVKLAGGELKEIEVGGRGLVISQEKSKI